MGGESEQRVQEQHSAAWKQAVQAVEAEMCGVMDLIKEGKPNEKWCGRGEDMATVKRYVLPRRAAGGRGQMRQCHYSAIWTKNRISDLLALVQKEKQQGTLTQAQAKQWNDIVRKFCSP